MIKNLFLTALITAFLALWSCSEDVLGPDREKLDDKKSKLQNREFVSDALTDNLIGNDNVRQMQVYTPPGYDKHGDKEYPVVYLLHGLPFSEKSFIWPKLWEPWVGPPSPFIEGPDFPEEGFREWMDGLIAAQIVQPMIIVMPDASNVYGFSFYTNSVLNGNFEDFIVKDLMQYIDSNYRTVQGPEGRAVIGFSQGGYAAVKFGMLHPDKFGVVAGHTGLLYLDGMLVLGPVVAAENPDGFVGPDPAKFLTSAAYAMSSAWSPNLYNPPFMVDLPFEYPSGAVIPEVRDRWLQYDVFTMLDNPDYLNNLKSLQGVYVDAGLQDELGMHDIVGAFAYKMTLYNVPHTFESFEGGHFNRMFSRLEISLAFCSNRMQ